MGSVVKAKECLPNHKKESRFGNKTLVFKEDEIDGITNMLDSEWIRHQERHFCHSSQRSSAVEVVEMIPSKLDYVTVDPTTTKKRQMELAFLQIIEEN